MVRRKAWLVAVLGVAALVNLIPFLYQVGLSLAPPERIFASPWPFTGFTLDNYQYLLEKLPFGRYVWNTLVFALGVSLGHLLLSLLAAYAFVRYRFPLQEALFALFLVSLMVPFVVTYLPSYLLVAQLGLLNTFPGLILPMLTAGYGVFLLRQHFRHFPKEVLEAALVDGADGLTLLFRVLAPASLATLVALFLIALIGAWNQFVWPGLVANRPEMYVLTVAVQRFAGGEGGSAWGPLMAASVLATLPAFLLFLLFRRAVIKTFMEGGVRG